MKYADKPGTITLMNGDHQPGSVIQPGDQNTQAAPAPAPAPAPVQPVVPTVPQAQPVVQPTPLTPAPAPHMPAAPSAPEALHEEAGAVSWTASEYIAHQKGSGWWFAFIAIVLLIGAAAYVVTRDIVSVIAIVGVAAMFGYYARRPPVVQQYSITSQGVHIGEKLYAFAELKSFTVVHQGAFASIEFRPLKRFMPYIPMYYAPDQEEAIMDTLTQYLPYEERPEDPIDRLMQKIRF